MADHLHEDNDQDHHDHHGTAKAEAHPHHGHDHSDPPSDIRGSGNFIIAGLTSGHGVFHWFLQSF
ncbi:MAG TPA: hypothetical protein EYP00_00105, partial [Dehalococcoidia bacterium]|nr:hypothetical protein [Dehalococcoidia bacterium]